MAKAFPGTKLRMQFVSLTLGGPRGAPMWITHSKRLAWTAVDPFFARVRYGTLANCKIFCTRKKPQRGLDRDAEGIKSKRKETR